jgi:hypothetical protein
VTDEVSGRVPDRALYRSGGRWLRGSAVAGGVAWLALFVAAPGMEWTHRMLALATLVIVPLALAAVSPGGPRSATFFAAAAWLQPLAGLSATASLFFPHGATAAALAAPQVGLTLLVFLLGRIRFSEAPSLRGRRTAADWAESGALLYLLLGGGWLAVTRAGGRPFDFDPVIVLLAAVHFHYATLAPPILAGRAARLLAGTRVARALPAIVFALLAGPGLVGLGIIGSPVTALVGTMLLTLGLFALAALNLIWVLRRLPSMLARVLLALASLAPLLTMPLACAYSWGVVTGEHSVDLLWMLRLHGMVNAFGVALCGLLAWTLIAGVSAEAPQPQTTTRPPSAPSAPASDAPAAG